MKKSLVLLSVLAASAAAHAQSSVSLTGNVDAYVQRAEGSLVSRSMLSSGGNSTSKLRIRGNEDLGGGLSAGFWLESGLALDTGSGQATNTNNQPSGGATAPNGTQGMTFNRRSIVYLRGKWGEIHAGRDWSPSYDTFTSRFDVFGVGSGIGMNYTASVNTQAVRLSNDIAYVTPRFYGFLANIQHWAGENPSGTPTAKDGTGNGIQFKYDMGKFGAVASYMRTDFAAGDLVIRNAAAIYDFGPLILTGNINNDYQGTLKQKGGLLGVRVPIGAGEFKSSYSVFKTNATSSNPEAKKFAVGYVYNFSPRTAVYTTLAYIRNSNGSSQAIAGSTTAPNASSKGFDLGIRNDF